MKYSVDSALCSGHGQCQVVAGGVFELDDEGYNRANGQTIEVPAGLEEATRRGAASCPDQAIRLST